MLDLSKSLKGFFYYALNSLVQRKCTTYRVRKHVNKRKGAMQNE